MPLVVFCGFPSSAKTTRAAQLVTHIKEKYPKKKLEVISDHVIGIQRNDIYADSKKEIHTRGNLKSAVQRFLNKDDVVILDSLNYIKGYRYELYCVAKASSTPHCVIFCDTNAETCSEWNKKREECDQYSQEVFDALVMRFEPPKTQNRWDSPLFVIQVGDELPVEAICDSLFQRKAPPPNFSTQSQPLSSTNFLYELDRITQEIVGTIMESQKLSVPGDQLTIPGSKDKIVLNRTLTLGELQRHRRQYISYTKTHPVEDTSKIPNMFVQYLNNCLL